VAETTGPILAAAGIVVFNAVIVHNQPWQSETKVIVGAGITAAGLSLWEKAMPRTALAFSWLVLATVLLVRMDPAVPSPLESFRDWYYNLR
jgi:hypothetical protein